MSLWVLDTDMLTLWLPGQETIAARVAATPPQQLAVTIITIDDHHYRRSARGVVHPNPAGTQ